MSSGALYGNPFQGGGAVPRGLRLNVFGEYEDVEDRSPKFGEVRVIEVTDSMRRADAAERERREAAAVTAGQRWRARLQLDEANLRKTRPVAAAPGRVALPAMVVRSEPRGLKSQRLDARVRRVIENDASRRYCAQCQRAIRADCKGDKCRRCDPARWKHRPSRATGPVRKCERCGVTLRAHCSAVVCWKCRLAQRAAGAARVRLCSCGNELADATGDVARVKDCATCVKTAVELDRVWSKLSVADKAAVLSGALGWASTAPGRRGRFDDGCVFEVVGVVG